MVHISYTLYGENTYTIVMNSMIFEGATLVYRPDCNAEGGCHANRPIAPELSKQRRRRWFETPSRSLWRHCNVLLKPRYLYIRTNGTDTKIINMCNMAELRSSWSRAIMSRCLEPVTLCKSNKCSWNIVLLWMLPLSHWSLGDVVVILKVWFSNSSYKTVAWPVAVWNCSEMNGTGLH